MNRQNIPNDTLAEDNFKKLFKEYFNFSKDSNNTLSVINNAYKEYLICINNGNDPIIAFKYVTQTSIFLEN